MKHISSILLFLFFFTFSLSAESIVSLLSRPDKDYPLSNTVRWEDDNNPGLLLLPDLPESYNIFKRFTAYHPIVTVERFYRIKLPAVFKGNTSESRRRLFTAILNIFGKPETQVGYTYHSSRRNKDIVFLQKSYISDKRGKRIDGFYFTPNTLPDNFIYYQFIDDVNSAGTVFEQKIITGNDFLSYRSTNIESVRIFIFPVMNKGGTRNEILFFTSGEYLYIYNCGQVLKEPALKSLGFSVNVSSMFRKRMDIMARWMEDQLSELNK